MDPSVQHQQLDPSSGAAVTHRNSFQISHHLSIDPAVCLDFVPPTAPAALGRYRDHSARSKDAGAGPVYLQTPGQAVGRSVSRR